MKTLRVQLAGIRPKPVLKRAVGALHSGCCSSGSLGVGSALRDSSRRHDEVAVK